MIMMYRYLMVILLAFSFCTTVHAEYVVYKTTSNMIKRSISLHAPSSKEFQTAYKIILKYKWPTSVYTFYTQPSINLQGDEESAIRAELHKAYPSGDVEIAFIPTVIYEAAFLAPKTNYQDGESDGQETLLTILGTKEWGRIIDGKVLEALNGVQNKDQETQYKAILNYMYQLNEHPKVLSIAEKVNSNICSTLEKDFTIIKKMDLTTVPAQIQMKHSTFRKVKHAILGNPRPTWNLSAAIEKYFQDFSNPSASWVNLLNKFLTHSMIQEVAMLEVEAHKNNQALIFRGAKQDSPLRFNSSDTFTQMASPEMQKRENLLKAMKAGSTPDISHVTKPFSLSYGFSLMAGMATSTGGNVYEYTVYSGLGYALKIDKASFFDRTKKLPRNLFWIPPFGTVFSFYGIDDLFHPRTTVGLTETMKGTQFTPEDYVYSRDKRTSDKLAVDQFFSYSPIVWVVGVDKTMPWDTKVSSLTDFIGAHAVPFYDPNNQMKDGKNILSIFHADDLLFLKKHRENFLPTLAAINKRGEEAERKAQAELLAKNKATAQPTQRRPFPGRALPKTPDVPPFKPMPGQRGGPLPKPNVPVGGGQQALTSPAA